MSNSPTFEDEILGGLLKMQGLPPNATEQPYINGNNWLPNPSTEHTPQAILINPENMSMYEKAMLELSFNQETDRIKAEIQAMLERVSQRDKKVARAIAASAKLQQLAAEVRAEIAEIGEDAIALTQLQVSEVLQSSVVVLAPEPQPEATIPSEPKVDVIAQAPEPIVSQAEPVTVVAIADPSAAPTQTLTKRPHPETWHADWVFGLEIESDDKEALIAEAEYLCGYFGQQFKTSLEPKPSTCKYAWRLSFEDWQLSFEDYEQAQILETPAAEVEQVKEILEHHPAIEDTLSENDKLIALGKELKVDMVAAQLQASVVSPPLYEFKELTYKCGYVAKSDGTPVTCYLGGNNKSKLKEWGQWLVNQHSVGNKFELREAKRLTENTYELKIWGMSLKQIQNLSETDTNKSAPSRYHEASKPVAAKLLSA